ncbi:hypothetical protein BDW71DRAFT_216650 [Aspergillus fruticulosus]
MDGVSDAASLVTVVQLAAYIINYIKSVVDAPVQKRKLLAALVQARGLLSTLVELTKEVEDEDWSYTIQSLSARNGPLSTFRELLEHIARKLGVTPSGVNISTTLNRLRWPFDHAGLQEMVASLENLKSHFLLAMANDHIRLSKTIRNELHKVQSQLTEATINAQRRTMVSLSTDQELIVNSFSLGNLSGKLDGGKAMEMRASTEWFLLHEKFRQWHSASPTPSTLVLTGRPGSGKSSICQVTRFFLKAWHRSDIDVCVAYIVFPFSQREKLSQSLVLSNIVQQVLLERPYLIEHVAALSVTGGPLSSAKSINLISRARRDLKQLYLILDELDACETTSRDVINALRSIEPPLSILVSSRPTGVLSEALQHCALVNTDAMPLCHHLETIKEMLKEDPHIVDYLHISGMVKRLAQAETRAMFERLLHNPSSSIIEIYELMLDDLMHQSAELATLAKKTLRTILDAAGPVSICQLTSALAPELSDVASARRLGRDLTEAEIVEAFHSSCKGFVSFAGKLSRLGQWFHLIHKSAKDLLENHGISE